ncbi:MAG: S9 family peptidase [Planctomycetes bacterium]|nr:S9 family peptidase [Planctomycetota bacterium]
MTFSFRLSNESFNQSYPFGGPFVSRSIPFVFLAAVCFAESASAQKHPFTVDDMLAMERVSEPSVSPDGKRIVFTKRTTDLGANKGRTDLWLYNDDGGKLTQLTSDPASDTSPRWSNDGKFIYFLSSRGGSTQIWSIAADGGEARQVSKFPSDVGNFLLFPDGSRFLLTMEVYPDATPEQTAARDDEREKSKIKARVYNQLLFRHWDSWEDGKRSHIFTWAPGAAPVDLMLDWDADAPTHPFGGTEEIAISPNGKFVVFASKVMGREAAWSTNVDLWLSPSDGSSKPRCLTTKNKALDNNPVFSPDGETIAYLAMARPGFEADKQTIWLLDAKTKESRPLTDKWDRSAASIEWGPEGKTIFATADNVGQKSIFAIDVATGNAHVVIEKGTNELVHAGGDRIVYLQDSLTSPSEIYSCAPDGSDARALTKINAARCAEIDWGAFEQFSFKGAKDETVYGFVMKPAAFDENKKYPVAFLVHGGPQGSFGNHFHYRWNPEFYAGRGYAAVFIDFHGSTGYGQKFTDAISGDWGGAPYDDLIKGLDFVGQKYAWADISRASALGASYGGYMMNWIAGHTDRFKCIVTHASNLDERMAYFDTEELWFPEWEHGGLPWENPEGYTKHNPIDFVKNWKTPTLVTHSANDFRVVDTQGISVFTALQRKGIPSRLIYFPDENHWILKPQNSKFWHEEVGKWLDQWCKQGG